MTYHFDTTALEIFSGSLVEIMRILQKRFWWNTTNIETGSTQGGTLFDTNRLETELCSLFVFIYFRKNNKCLYSMKRLKTWKSEFLKAGLWLVQNRFWKWIPLKFKAWTCLSKWNIQVPTNLFSESNFGQSECSFQNFRFSRFHPFYNFFIFK